MARLARQVIASYEARVSSVEQIIEATHEMLEAFRSQREAMRTQLRDTLAMAASLRRRDFDAMMQAILAGQEERQERVKEAMRGYLSEHKATAQALKEALSLRLGRTQAGLPVCDAQAGLPACDAQAGLANGEAKRIETVEELLGEIMARQEKREREVRALLAEFQREQEEMAHALGGLLSNGGSIKVKDFKATLRTIQACHRAGRHEGGRDGGRQMCILRGEGARSI
jgi:phage-related tail protein